MRISLLIRLACAAAILALLAGACAPGPSLDIPTTPPTAVAAGPGQRLAGVLLSPQDLASPLMAVGLRDAAAHAGLALALDGAGGDTAREARLIDQLISQRAELLIVTPASAGGSIAALKKARAAGVAVICFKTCVDDPHAALAVIAAGERELGEASGDAALKLIVGQLGGRAQAGLLTCGHAAGCADLRAGFVNRIRLVPGVEIAAEQIAGPDGSSGGATTTAEALLAAHPEIDVLWGATPALTAAGVAAVQALGLAGRVHVFGAGIDEPTARLLSEGDVLQGVAAYPPYQAGSEALETVLAIVDGRLPAGPVALTPVTLTAENAALAQAYLDRAGALVLVTPTPAATLVPGDPGCNCFSSPAHPALPTPE